jgi:hypothetical protein
MSRLVTAVIATALPTDGVPTEIVYIPEGEHELTPYVDGKPQRIQVRMPAAKGAAIAAKFQSDLEARQSLNVRPWTDFDHERKKSSGNPTGFRYEAGRGLIMSMDWSKGGREALEGKDFSVIDGHGNRWTNRWTCQLSQIDGHANCRNGG